MIVSANDLIASAKSQCNCMDQLAAKLFYDRHEDAIIIDVREHHEVEEACLIDSTHIPRGVLEMKITTVCENADTPILLHCAAGARASLAASTLQMMGYSNVHVIDAPFDEIRNVFG
ncbi:MAG: sulfurtransferase [Proteobacteria bacterium]|nr:sulfurtransferase [Pseudomonadota bacterium]NOG61110.1 sulfurtransferase [Pseudomonadota bacterium]